MSIYRMVRKGIEFDAARDFKTAEEAKHFTNTTGLIDVINHCIAKFDHMTCEEGDEEEVAEERLVLVQNLVERAFSCVKGDDPKAIKRIAAAQEHHATATRSADTSFRRATDRRFT